MREMVRDKLVKWIDSVIVLVLLYRATIDFFGNRENLTFYSEYILLKNMSDWWKIVLLLGDNNDMFNYSVHNCFSLILRIKRQHFYCTWNFKETFSTI